MQNLKLIRTKKEHDKALERLEKLMTANPEEATPEAEELELLAILIEYYEDKIHPIPAPDPIEAIKFRMEQMGLSRKDLEEYIGSRARVSEILNHKRNLTLPMIKKLHAGLDIPTDMLIGAM